MRKMNKKGFTIVELVIVIAVIAILAAVLIPTYSSLVKKANLSADQQAVKQMNTALAICDETPKTIADAKNALAKSGYDANEYKPLSTGYEFYWVPSLNRVILTDSDNAVVFPADLATDAKNVETTWFSLSASGNYADVEAITDQINANKTDITLTDTNFKGASINLKISQNTTIGGSAEKPATLTNMVSDEGSRVNAGKDTEYAEYSYYCGLISEVPAGTSVTVQNLVIDGAVIGDTTNPASARVGIIAGQVAGTLNIENVTIRNCTVFGEYRVGSLVGYVSDTGTVNIKNVTIEDTTVKGATITAAVIGQIMNKSTVTIENLEVKNVNVVPSEYNGAVTDSGKVMTVNGNQYVGSGFPYLTSEYYWLQYDKGNNYFANEQYTGINFWPYKGVSEGHTSTGN